MSDRTDMKSCLHALWSMIAVCALVFPAAAMADDDWVRVTSPVPGSETVAKKPDISAEFLRDINTEKLMVTLDGTDVTQVMSLTGKGFEYTPFLVLPPGQHLLVITTQDAQGNTLTSQSSFTTRHTGPFEEAYSKNDVSVVYTETLDKSESLVSVPYWKVEGNIASTTKVREGGAEASFTTNVRYLEQSIPLGPPDQSKKDTFPLSKGFNVANWLAQCGYTRGKFGAHVSVGDVSVDRTPYTVTGLARRGGMLDLSYDMFSVGAFSVRGDKVYGFRGGTGIDPDTDRHISGVSAAVKLPDNQAELRAVYASGGEPASSFGITTKQGAKKGDVAGVMLVTDLLQGKLRTEFEADTARFDPDTADEFHAKSDYAYRLKAGGYVDTYNYDVMYEYVGKEYISIGNQGLENDRRGVTASGGGTFGPHNVGAVFTWKEKNVEGDPLVEKTNSYMGSANYTFMKFPSLPMGLGYTKTLQDAASDPPNLTPKENQSDTVNGWINYTWDRLNLGLMSSYSELDDRTSAAADTTAINYALTSSYNAAWLTVSPSFMLSQSKVHLTGVWTDVYTVNLDTRTRFLDDKGAFDLGGSYVITDTSDGLVDTSNLSLNVRLSYMLKELEDLMKGFMKPAIAVTGTYTNFDDRHSGTADRDEYVIYLQLTTSIPLSI